MMFALPLVSLLLATTGLAAPSLRKRLDVPASALQLPSGQTQLVAPTTAPDFVSVGVGNQNYSCTAWGNYSSVGTVAQMFDITGLYGTPEFSQVQDGVYGAWSDYQSTDPFDNGLAIQLSSEFEIDVIGQYYFIIDATGSLVPKWDFTTSGSTAFNPDAFVVAEKVGAIPAPTGSQDIDWVQLKGVEGKLASDIFRVDTVAGQPPSSCTPGSPEITVKYSAIYYFFGSTLST